MAKTTRASVTIEMVAAEAGVSKTTVSFVMNNNPTISETTRARVLKIARALGYQPNVNARNLSSSKRNRAVCVLMPEIGRLFDDPYFSRAIGGIYDELEAADYRLVLRKASFAFAREKEYLNLFRRGEVAGMLYVGSTLEDIYLKDFVETGYPFVLVNSNMPDVALSHAQSDNEWAGFAATRHLLELGHRRIAHITGSRIVASSNDRAAGYRRALAEADIPFHEELVAEGRFNRRDAAGAAMSLMGSAVPPTAIYVGNDLMALGVLEAFEQSEIRVPEQVAIVGTDNIELSAFSRPALTTIDTRIFDVARESVRLLISLMDGIIKGPEERIQAATPVIRASCGVSLRHAVSA